MLHDTPEHGEQVSHLYSAAGLVRLASSRCGAELASGTAELPALQNLCAAFEAARPGQTTFGKFYAKSVLLNALMKRCRLADYMRRFPEIGTLDPPNPVFIVAPFRTGTTFLHRLLSRDPQNRWPRLWEVAYPPPGEPHLRGDARYFTDDPRIVESEAALRTLYRAGPALGRLHPMAPDLAEECFGLLETSLLSHSFMFYAELPSYLDWLDTRHRIDWREAYEFYAAQLRLLQWWYPGRRWVLKSPVHLWNLDVLLETFPQAHIIQLHRDPADAMGSFCRLLTAYRQVMCKSVVPAAISQQAERYTCTALGRAVSARRHADAARFIDVAFSELIADPIACVRAIYARLGMRLGPEVVDAMTRR